MLDKMGLTIEKNRMHFVDLFRGIGILLMIMGHIGFGNKFYRLIHAFHMPMFFFVSGYFFDNAHTNNIKLFCKKCFIKFIVPYFVYGITYYFIWLICNWQDRCFKPLFNLLLFNTDGLPIGGALWFLTAFWWSQLIYVSLSSRIKDFRIKLVVCGICGILGCILPESLPFRLPWAVDSALVGVAFLGIGQLIRSVENKNMYKMFSDNIWINLIIGVIIVYIINWNGTVNMRRGVYQNIPVFWINAIFSILVGWNLCKSIDSYIKNGFLLKILAYLKQIGKTSISYLCMNQFFIWILSIFLQKINLNTSQILNKLVILVLTVVLINVVDIKIRKSNYRFLLGI